MPPRAKQVFGDLLGGSVVVDPEALFGALVGFTTQSLPNDPRE